MKDIDTFLRQKRTDEEKGLLSHLDKDTLKEVIEKWNMEVKVKVIEEYNFEMMGDTFLVKILGFKSKKPSSEDMFYEIGRKLLMTSEVGIDSNIFKDDDLLLFDPEYLDDGIDSIIFLKNFKNC